MAMANRRSAGEAITPTISWFTILTGLRVVIYLAILEIREERWWLLCSMLARRQEINTQLQVLIDAFLLALSLWAAYVLRYYSTFWFGLSKSVDEQSNYAWLLIPIMVFGPILLDLQGFYQSPLNKTKWRSIVQIVRAMIGLSIIISACVIFLRFSLSNRTVPLLFIFIGTIVLLLKELLRISYLRRKALRGEQREPVLLAGSPQDVSALEQSFPPEQRLLVDVVARIDIER